MKKRRAPRSAGGMAIQTAGEVAASYSVPAVDKALDILELLGDASPGMSHRHRRRLGAD